VREAQGRRSQDFKNKEETYTVRNAMGTGPFILVSREPDVKSVFRKNPEWWGLKEKGYFDGNVTDIIYSPVKNEGTRMAALLSGDLDFVLDPAVQDVESSSARNRSGSTRAARTASSSSAWTRAATSCSTRT